MADPFQFELVSPERLLLSAAVDQAAIFVGSDDIVPNGDKR